ncbi:hypothetical protein V5O48_015372 [Marasmius crinis-equi]|uniref:Uncharacterized protein n=1 Tax=Marasmius crinis-equi TaxID=585013 RepID=A0ABR3EUQ1_9AGAR
MCQWLQKIELHISQLSHGSSTNNTSKGVFPYLEYLDIDLSFRVAPKLIDSITLPSLTTLKLSLTDPSIYYGSASDALSSLVAFLQRSRCNIRVFELRFLFWLATELTQLAEIFALCPDMRRLSLSTSWNTDWEGPSTPVFHVTSLLTVNDHHTPSLLPELETMEIVIERAGLGKRDQQAIAQRFLDVVESRSSSLQFAALTVPDYYLKPGEKNDGSAALQDIISRVDALPKDGVKCIIKGFEDENRRDFTIGTE